VWQCGRHDLTAALVRTLASGGITPVFNAIQRDDLLIALGTYAAIAA
jgi:hypothetical protein